MQVTRVVQLRVLIVGRDARFGVGSYLTELNPSRGEEFISNNNWGKLKPERMRGVIVVQIPTGDEKLKKEIDKNDEQRDIYRYKGKLTLSKYRWGYGTFEE